MRNRALLLFVDGVGIGRADRIHNPFFALRLPFLHEALRGVLPARHRPHVDAPDALCIPANATLRIPGLPQSGTGQSTLYTGVNTAQLIGRHFGPYLFSTTKPVVASLNLFEQAMRSGIRRRDIALANAFPQRFFDYLAGQQRRMVAGMYAAQSSGIPFRDIGHLKAGTAVSADITAQRWKEIGHPDAPVSTPLEAGRTLARIAATHRLTLFEYFQTDKAGHERSMHLASDALLQFDALLRGVVESSDLSQTLIIVTSDHGNMEDLSVKTHTRNAVPVFLFGEGRHRAAARIRSIRDITPAILDHLFRAGT